MGVNATRRPEATKRPAGSSFACGTPRVRIVIVRPPAGRRNGDEATEGGETARGIEAGRPHERPIWSKGTKRTLPSKCRGYA